MSPQESDQGPESLSRKQRRDQAREQRREAEAAEASSAARRRRLTQLGGVAVTVIVIIVVIVVASGSKGSASDPAVQSPHAKNVARNEVLALLNGVPQNGNVLGKPNAPVTIQYFGDLECSICKEFTLGALPGIVANEVRTGKAKIEYKSFATATGTAESEGAQPKGTFISQQVGAYAAGKQNLAWYFIELFYHEQGEEGTGYVTESYIQNLAKQVPGLNLTQWSANRADKALEDEVYADEKAASKNGFKGTPSFLVGKTGGHLTPYEASHTESKPFEELINKYAS